MRTGSARWIAASRWAMVFGLSIGLCACRKPGGAASGRGVPSLGKRIGEGPAADLRLTGDRKYATYLANPKKPRLEGIPPPMRIGALHTVALGSDSPRKLGEGITNVPGGYLFSPDSHWVVYLAGYNAANQSGELYAAELANPASTPVRLGQSVSYSLVSPDSRWVALVDSGILKLGTLPQGPFREVGGEVATAQFSPDSRFLIYQRKLSAGAALMATRVDLGKSWRLAEQVGDYQPGPDSRSVVFARHAEGSPDKYDLFLTGLALPTPGSKSAEVALPAKRLGSETGFFSFSPDGKWLGWIEGKKSEGAGQVMLAKSDGTAVRKIGDLATDFSFAPDSTAVAYLDSYSDAARAGVIAVTTLPEGKPRRIGNRVPNFSWGADGRFLAFLSRFVKPVYSVDLMLYPLAEEKPFKVNTGVFGYGFSPHNRHLFLRTNCIRDGRACDLYQLDLDKLKEPPKKILEGIYTFKASDDEQRLLVTYARVDLEAFDVAVYNLRTGERRTIDQRILLPPMFTTSDGTQVIYLVTDPSRAGLYVADRLP